MTVPCFKLKKCCCWCGCKVRICVGFMAVIYTHFAIFFFSAWVQGVSINHKHVGDLIFACIQWITLGVCVFGFYMACCCGKKVGRCLFFYAYAMRMVSQILFMAALFYLDTTFAYLLVIKAHEDRYIKQ